MKIKYLLFTLILFIPQVVLAAPNASISTSANSIEKGKSVTLTVTLTDTAAWNIKMTGSGAATCSTKQADVTGDGKSTTKNLTLTCTPANTGTINFKVTGDITSGSGASKDISLTKDVTVTNPKSSDNLLKDLKVDGVTVSGFSGSKTSYTLKETNKGSISISATVNDSKATISGVGNKTLKYGKNTFNVVVTAENGSTKTYSIIITKTDSRSKNNNLKSLSINVGNIDFDKNTTNYLVKVEHDIEEVKISATPEDSKSSVSGVGTKQIKDYTNQFEINVKAENGSTKTYIVKVVRKDASGNYGKLSTDNSVKSISIKNYDINFNETVKKYNILVEDNVNEVEFNVIPKDSKSTVSIQNDKDLKIGLNVVKVIITSENGEENEYIFNVYKMGEEEYIEPTPKKEDNIWIIISGIEFLIILTLLITKLITKKQN